MNKFFINIKDNLLHTIKSAIRNVTKKIHIKNTVDFSDLMQNRKMVTTRLFITLLACVLCAVIILSPTQTSHTENELYPNTAYESAIRSNYAISLIQESKKEPFEIHSFNEELLNELESERAAYLEQDEKEDAAKAKYRKNYKNKYGIYTAPPVAPSSGFIYYDVPLSRDWQVYTYNLCQEYGVSYEVMLGLMFAESNFRFNATSGVAWGICQIHQCHASYAKSIGIEDYKEPEGNIKLGIMFMSKNLKKYDGDYHKALIAYNYGDGGAQKHCFSQGIFQTSYSKKVMKYANNLAPK